MYPRGEGFSPEDVGARPEPPSPEFNEQREWTTAETVEFIKDNWKGFFHNHPQEMVRDSRTPELTVDVASFFTDTWDMDYHGTLQHMQKAYPEERVLPPARIQAEAEKLCRERGGEAEQYLDEAFERLRALEYHTPGDVEASASRAREQSHGEKTVIGGAEVDLTVTTGPDGRLRVSSLTPNETVDTLDVDYLVYSIHPDTNPLLKEIAGQPGDPNRPGDPERLTQVYEAMVTIAADARRNNPHHPIILGGHPLSRTEARQQLSIEHKARIIDAFTDHGIPLEISLNDYYWWRPKRLSEAETEMAEKVPMLDPEFLDLIRSRGTLIYIDTDLHFGDWLRDREREAATAPTKLGRSADTQRDFSAATMAEDLEGWQDRGLMGLPRYLRPQVARFIRVVRHLLRSGIKPEQIVNTKTLPEIRQLESLSE